MESLPVLAPSCPLDSAELRAQLGRYRAVGESAEVIEWEKHRRVIRVAREVPASTVDKLVEVERACCSFFALTWDRTSRCLTISVSASDYESALDAIGFALGVVEKD